MENNLSHQYTSSSKDLSSGDSESFAPVNMIHAGRLVYQAIESLDAAITAQFKIHRSDLQCLNLLEEGPATPKAIRERLGLSSGAVTALVDRLEGAGYVRRVASAQDRRSIVVEMLPEVFEQLGKIYMRVAKELVAQFGSDTPEEQEVGCRALLRFAGVCEQVQASLSSEAEAYS